MRNPLKRRPRDEAKPTLRERAAALKATAGRVIRRKPRPSTEAVATMARPVIELEGTVSAPDGRATSASPALTEMVEAWQALAVQIEGENIADEVAEALSSRHTELQIAICRFPAASVADLLAKVPVFRDEMRDATGGLNPDFRPENTLSGAAWLGLFRDIERLAAVVSPERAVPAGDDLSQTGLILFEDTAGRTRRKPVAEWIAFMAARLYHAARNEQVRRFNVEGADLSGDASDALHDLLRRDLRVDALHDLAFRSREVFEVSREYAVGDRWRNGRGDATDVDAELLALEAEFLPAHRAVVAARVAHDLAWDRYVEPSVPRELRVWRNDWIIRKFPRTWTETLEAVGEKFVSVTHYGPPEVAQLRGMRCLRPVYRIDGDAPPDPARAVPDERAQERVDAIVAAWDRWQAEIVATKEYLGLPALDEAFEAAKDRRGAILDRLRAVPARTLAGLGVKARVAFAMDDDTDPKRTGLDEYDTEHPAAFVYAVAGDVLALTAAPTAEA